jgi:hypothetical protein
MRALDTDRVFALVRGARRGGSRWSAVAALRKMRTHRRAPGRAKVPAAISARSGPQTNVSKVADEISGHEVKLDHPNELVILLARAA